MLVFLMFAQGIISWIGIRKWKRRALEAIAQREALDAERKAFFEQHWPTNMRGFTAEEAVGYRKALKSLFKPLDDKSIKIR